jgi:sugar lactone lactonase YvrE
VQLEILFDFQAELGEGPAWSAREGCLYWLDILFQLEQMPGCLAPTQGGGLLLALGSGFVSWDSGPLGFTRLADVNEPSFNRFNDGKCDPAGRFLAGTMDHFEKEISGNLYSLSGKQATCLLSGVTISNGLAWSPDYQTLYYIDTPRRDVQAFDYDLSSGTIANGRVAFRVPEALGWPDGMTSDLDGNLWIAMWGGAQVTQWDPRSGCLLQSIPLPAPQTSSCVFGGAGMNELYITSARKQLTETQLHDYPLSGAVFKVTTKVTGMPTFEFSSVA